MKFKCYVYSKVRFCKKLCSSCCVYRHKTNEIYFMKYLHHTLAVSLASFLKDNRQLNIISKISYNARSPSKSLHSFFFYNVAERNVLAIFKANHNSLKRVIELFLHTFFSLNLKNSNGSIL